jgi:Spy/CpxP family protein refolding chaperone
MKLKRKIIAAATGLAITLGGAQSLLADPQHGPQGMGPGMMGGYGPGYGMGPGMMGGYGPGYGMGPGMMGGHGPGYGMGPGMMGGYGPGYGMGPGMMGGYGSGVDLNEKQREKLAKIQEETARKRWELMGKMQDERFRMRELFAAGKHDEAAVEKSFKRMEELRRQMFDSMLEERKQMDGVLTQEQRERMRRSGPRW